MKIKIKDLLKLKININCKNTVAYQDIAYLVDKPEFLSLLPEFRKRYQIEKLVPLEKFKDWMLGKIKEDLRIYGTEGRMVLDAEKFYGKNGKKTTHEEQFDSLPYHQRFDWETVFLTRKFNRPSYFRSIIQRAIVCGEVDEESWQPTYATVLPPELPVTDSDLPEVVIVVSPMSRPTDVEKVFKEDVPKIFNAERSKFKYQTVVKKDSTKNIIRDRNWYWLSLEGKEPGDIYDSDFGDPDNPPPKRLEEFRIDSISKAIDRYIEKLQDKF